ncbi:GNAT family N-acetyltransferase [Paenibacillus campinasensis]|uniref:GNAT family N-acetyltransferase n=1 Tax=Paenibacillus campinasensis TaxID=66347 RepID=A0ABW9SXQ4_9BACL|nr:GNAT family N-acetyltransferase [Paenibacillus campinasensis]MUG65096.1 GNAT family N-acetyltransferase [Paenibacillus campinasensis]
MIEIVEVTADNIQDKGFFCMRSKPKTEGYQRKQEWLLRRFEEGLKLKIIEEDGYPRGFMEYTPIEFAWRGVTGENYLFIHCLWIVGRGKGKGYGKQLLNDCIEDARRSRKSGVSIMTSSQTWLADKSFFTKQGFELVDQTPSGFELLARRFDDSPVPRLVHGWEERAAGYREGLTILKSDQCPYIQDAVTTIVEVAQERNIPIQVMDMESSGDAQHAVSAYGSFNVIYNGKLLTYHPVTKRELYKLLDQA